MKYYNRKNKKMNTLNRLKISGIILFLISMSSPAISNELGKIGIGARLYTFETGTTSLYESDMSFDSAYPLDLNLTWRFADSFSVELSSTQIKQDVDAKNEDFSGYLGEITQTPVFLTFRYERQIHESDIRMYFGVGGAYFINEFDFKKKAYPDTFFGANYNNLEMDDSFAMTLSLGAEYRFNGNYALCGDIRLILNQADFSIEYVDGTKEDEDVGLTSSMFGLGIKYYF